jgi:ketosteroid isomerase-like protein
MPILAALIILSALVDPDRPAMTAQSNDRAAISSLISRYIECFNARDAECILDLYADHARIKVDELTGDEWVGVDRYAGRLRKKLDDYEQRGARITSHDIEELRMSDRRADIVISVTAEQSIFSKDFSGSFGLAKTSQGWLIIRDEF